jgi:hypothetical protein
MPDSKHEQLPLKETKNADKAGGKTWLEPRLLGGAQKTKGAS